MSSNDLSGLLARAEAVLDRLAAVLPAPGQSAINAPDWAASVAFRYRKRGGPLGGLGLLDPVRHVGRICYEDLQEVDSQKERFARNLAQFVAGRPANNVLLSGARGTGKSSLVKAAHAEVTAAHGNRLKLVEIHREDIEALPELMRLIRRESGYRFIVFCDDLSFEAEDGSYKSLKAVLEGGIEGAEKSFELDERMPSSG